MSGHSRISDPASDELFNSLLTALIIGDEVGIAFCIALERFSWRYRSNGLDALTRMMLDRSIPDDIVVRCIDKMLASDPSGEIKARLEASHGLLIDAAIRFESELDLDRYLAPDVDFEPAIPDSSNMSRLESAYRLMQNLHIPFDFYKTILDPDDSYMSVEILQHIGSLTGAGAPITNKYGDNFLHLWLQFYDEDVPSYSETDPTPLMLSIRTCLNHQNALGNTPLHDAAMAGGCKWLNLLSYQPDLWIQNSDGETVVDCMLKLFCEATKLEDSLMCIAFSVSPIWTLTTKVSTLRSLSVLASQLKDPNKIDSYEPLPPRMIVWSYLYHSMIEKNMASSAEFLVIAKKRLADLFGGISEADLRPENKDMFDYFKEYTSHRGIQTAVNVMYSQARWNRRRAFVQFTDAVYKDRQEKTKRPRHPEIEGAIAMDKASDIVSLFYARPERLAFSSRAKIGQFL